MQLDVNIAPQSLAEVPALVAGAEEMGFDALWTSETGRDACAVDRICLG